MNNRSMAPLLIVGLPVAIIVGLLVMVSLMAGGASAACSPTSSIADASAEGVSVPGYSHEQLTNAAAIMAAGHALEVSARDQTIGVMTALGESSLLVLDHGDAAGPDSRGLFQQRDNGAWGTYEDRMDPFISATNFFQALKQVEERDTMTPTEVAHKVQRNANPNHYTPYWEPAVTIVATLTGSDMTSAVSCIPGAGSTDISADGWARPGAGPLTSHYGNRGSIDTSAGATQSFHTGLDMRAGGCGGPIYAAQDGRVKKIYQDTAGGWWMILAHSEAVETRYVHMYSADIMVTVGQPVAAGQQIARTGASGKATGCHLHFEVWINGAHTDPLPFLASVGITY